MSRPLSAPSLPSTSGENHNERRDSSSTTAALSYGDQMDSSSSISIRGRREEDFSMNNTLTSPEDHRASFSNNTFSGTEPTHTPNHTCSTEPSKPLPDMPKPPSQKKFTLLIPLIKDWWLEIGCVGVATGAILAIFATLFPFSGQPLPQWPYRLSINTLLSVYVACLKAAILVVITQGFGQLKWTWFQRTRPLKDIETYDEASRGSIRGALTMILRLRGLQTIPCLGAFVIIITTISDPMAQQLIHYKECQRLVPQSSASIPRANAYSNGGANQVPVGDADLVTIPDDLQAAIIAGVYSTNPSPIPFDCSTGNCTVPSSFRTIGYCSQCHDVSNELHLIPPKNPVTDSYPSVALPSGLTAVPGPATYTMAYAQVDSPCTEIIDASGLFSRPHCNAGNTSWHCLPYAAARCYLYPCVKTFEASVSGGDLHETQISKDEEWIPAESSWGPPNIANYMSVVDLECIDSQQKQSLQDIGYRINETTEFLPYNISFDHDYNNEDRWTAEGNSSTLSNAIMQIVPPKCIYSESIVTEQSLFIFFDNFFTGNMSMGPAVDVKPGQVINQIFIKESQTLEGISDVFRNISQAMTTVMRMTGAVERSDPAVGQVFRLKTCVDVQWEWLAFPTSLVVLTLVFFVGVLVKTRPTSQTNDHDYKSSVLALLLHGLEPRTIDRGIGGLERASAIAKEAKRVYVQLREAEDRKWGFVETVPDGQPKA